MHLNKTTRPNVLYNTLHLLGLILLTLFSTSVLSGDTSEQTNTVSHVHSWHNFNISTVNEYIIPAYKDLEKSTLLLNQAITKLCLAPAKSTSALTQAREAYHQAMDSWQHIQNIQFGPIQILMRNYSMQFWPDKKNHVGKHLISLLETNDPASLTEDAFHKASVSIKGLPAIERFLFEEDETQQLLDNPFHCQVLQRISTYTATMGHDLAVEWQDMKNSFTNTSQADSYFEDDVSAATSLLKALVEPIEVIRDLKLLRPLGSEFGQQKMKRLESWRSQRSLRNIKINIESLNHLYQGLGDIVSTSDKLQINQSFKQIMKQISSTSTPIELSIETKNGYNDLIKLSDSLKELHTLLETSVNRAGIHLGFNSRDGD